MEKIEIDLYKVLEPKNFTRLVTLLSIFMICGTVCIVCMSSCEARQQEAYYKFRTESDKVFFDINKKVEK